MQGNLNRFFKVGGKGDEPRTKILFLELYMTKQKEEENYLTPWASDSSKEDL